MTDDAEHTLRHLNPRLGALLRRGDAPASRAFAVECARFAVRRAHLDEPGVAAALGLRGSAPAVSLEELRRLVDALDEEGYRLREAQDEGKATLEEYLSAFSKARAAASVLACIEEVDDHAAAALAAYEAYAATEDTEALIRIARRRFDTALVRESPRARKSYAAMAGSMKKWAEELHAGEPEVDPDSIERVKISREAA